MKITKDYLKRIIKEEMNKVLREQSDSWPKSYYKTYFDFSGVKKTEAGNKLDFSEAEDLDERYDEIYIDDPGELYGGRHGVDRWAKSSAKLMRRNFKNPKEAESLMKELLEEYRESIENYVNLVNEVARRDVVTFDYETTKRKQASHILAEMIKLLSIGKRYDDYDY